MKSEFINFWSELFFKPVLFFKKRLRSDTEPRYFKLALIVFGIGYGIDRMDTFLMKLSFNSSNGIYTVFNNWSMFWIIAIIGGIIGGYILYLIGGWFFNLRVKWSKGTDDIQKSRYIYLYSGVILFIGIIIEKLVQFIFKSKPNSIYSDNIFLDIFSSLWIWAFIIYSIYISYTGVKSLSDTNKTRRIIWFLVLPIIFYLVSVIILVKQYFEVFN